MQSQLMVWLKKHIQSHPFFLLLLGLIGWIWIRTLHPGFDIVGWDNFSSYFNLKTQLLRTFFATWRSYRGLGVPSDSESVDIFRQLFYLVLSPFTSEALLEQFYILSMFSFGVTGMYKLVSQLIHMTQPSAKPLYKDAAGAFGAFWYVFNLNSLTTFYFPMVMFVNRFAFMPWLLVIALYLAQKKRMKSISKYGLIAMVVFTFFSSGMYLVATIFITTFLVLVLALAGSTSWKKAAAMFALYILTMSFWLLPFANYTIQKSSILPLAPTFIDTNEIQLNRPSKFFSLARQAVLYPSFLDISYKHLSDGKSSYFNPLTEKLRTPIGKMAYAFPFMYMAAALYILLRIRNKKLVWIPAGLVMFLFLSMKEYSILGFIYDFFTQHVPLFAVIFRFGDTKFHPVVALLGSIAIGVAWNDIVKTHLNRTVVIASVVGVCATLVLFSGTLSHGLVGDIMLNRVPSAYSQMAQQINADPDPVRVLHLPFDRDGYWKSYQWGMFGSSFLHAMLDKPLIDRTFEPASAENSRLDTSIEELTHNVQALSTEGLQLRAQLFAQLLEKTGTRYVIMDETVSPYIPKRDMLLWGTYASPDAKKLTEALVHDGFAEEVGKWRVDDSFISLIRLKHVLPQALFVDDARAMPAVDTHIQPHTTIQTGSGVYMPFYEKNVQLNESQSGTTMTFPDTILPAGDYTLSLPVDESIPPSKRSALIAPSMHINENGEVIMKFSHIVAPKIIDAIFQKPIGELVFQKVQSDRGVIHMLVNGTWTEVSESRAHTVLTLPSQLVRGNEIQVDTLKEFAAQEFQNSDFVQTDNPNCYGDAGSNYEHKVTFNPRLRISTTDGSTCIVGKVNVQSYHSAAIQLTYTTSQKSTQLKNIATAKPQLLANLQGLDSPQNLSVCVRTAASATCLNRTQNFVLQKSGTLTIPVVGEVPENTQLLLVLALRGQPGIMQSLDIQQAVLHQYIASETQKLEFQPHLPVSATLRIHHDTQLTVSYPHAESIFKADSRTDGFLGATAPCQDVQGGRFIRTLHNVTLSSVVGCSQDLGLKAPFDTENFYLWSAKMNVLSGKYPQFILDDQFNTYIHTYAGLYQGYPHVPGFHLFQSPEYLFTRYTPDILQNKLEALQKPILYTWIYPQTGLHDTKDKTFTLHHDGENESIVLLDHMTIQPLPNQWQGMTLSSSNAYKTYGKAEIIQAQQILPSLWRIEAQAKEKGPFMLRFQEGYDKQWGLYKSLFAVVAGKKIPAKLTQCDGYVQCYELADMPQSLYVFYAPERLSLIGWIISLMAVLAIWRICRHDATKPK